MEGIGDYVLKKMNKKNYVPHDVILFKYGLSIFVRYVVFFLIIFFITFFCGNFTNVLMFDLTLILLRFHCGGYHSKNVYSCFLLSVFTMAIIPQILLDINISKVINFFITELLISLQIVLEPVKNANKIYNEKFIKNIRKRKNIILLVINIIYIFLFNYYYNFGRMVTYACGFNFLSVVIAIILKWKEEE